jgi:hypothetical protein
MTLHKTTQYKCDICGRVWTEDPDPNNKEIQQCPHYDEDVKSGYNDIINAVHTKVYNHLQVLADYIQESEDLLMDELRDEIRRNLRGRSHK